MNKLTFNSVFAKNLEGFITQKRAIGYAFDRGAEALMRFDRFCTKHKPDESNLTKKLVDLWIEYHRGLSIGTQGIYLNLVRQFAQYLNTLGYDAYMIPNNILPKPQKYIPYIFGKKELSIFLKHIDTCHYWPGYPQRHLVMPLFFRFLYCCGLRVSEVCDLRLKDINLTEGVLKIYNSKFKNNRIVPMSATLTQRCRDYSKKVHNTENNENFFFQSRNGRPYSRTTIYFNFRQFLWAAGISHGGTGKGPRVHDFRHTFAVHCLKNWVENNKDLSAYLPVLKTYLGHRYFRETAYYLKLTADTFPSLTAQLDKSFGTLIPKVEVQNDNN